MPLPAQAVSLTLDEIQFPIADEDEGRDFVLTGRELNELAARPDPPNRTLDILLGAALGGVAVFLLTRGR